MQTKHLSRAAREAQDIRAARRSQHLTRMAVRTTAEATYQDFYDGSGSRVKGTYLGHVFVPNRQIQRVPPGFNTLLASVSHIDLTKANDEQLIQFAKWVK